MLQTQSNLFQVLVLATIAGFIVVGIIVSFVIFGFKRNIKFQKEMLLEKMKVQQNTLAQVSRELHDNIGLKLSVCRIYINNLEVKAKIEKDKTDLLAISHLLGEAINDIRDTVNILNPEKLETFSLEDALTHECEIINHTNLIKCLIEIEPQAKEKISKQNELLLFRICQEFIQNSVKHAKCQNITVNIFDKDEFVYVNLKDNGIGFNYHEKVETALGNGLRNIHSRANGIGATINYLPTNEGCFLQLIIPTKT